MMQMLKRVFPIILIVGISIPTMLPLFQSGFFEMHDDTQVSRIYLMWRALADGQFPVRWVQDLGYGYGYPIFNFYAPLPYYFGGIITALVGDSLLATKIVMGTALIAAGLSMYYLVRRFFGQFPAIVSAILYIYFPYHAVNLYVRGNVSELYAYIFIPLFFAALYGIYYSKKTTEYISQTVLLAVSFALIIISHNLSAYMTGMLGGIIVLLGLIVSHHKRLFLQFVVLGFAGGVGLAAFYWIPAIFEMQYTNVNSQLGGGAHFSDHFVCIAQFWNSPWGYTGSVPGCVDGMTFQMGKTNMLLAVGGLGTVLFAWYKKHITRRYLVLSAAGMMLVTVFLMTAPSDIVWQVVPGMEYLQFPWRFLNYFALFYALLVGYVFFFLKKKIGRNLMYLFGTLVVLGSVLYYGKLFTPQEIFERSADFYTDRSYIGFEVTKRSDEYLPPSFPELTSPEQIPRAVFQENASVSVSTPIQQTDLYEALVKANQPTDVQINIAYFPAWNAFIDGRQVTVTPQSRGFTVPVPAGSHEIRLQFVQTNLEKFANMVTLFAIGSLFVGIIHGKSYDKRHHSS